LSCSGVGPVLGYVNSVRTTVRVSGEDIEARDMDEGEVRWLELRVAVDFLRFRGFVMLNREDEDWDGR